MKSGAKFLTGEASSQQLDRLSFNIISIGWLDESTAKRSPRDILNYYKILVMLKGHATVHIGNDIYYTNTGDCVLFAPGSLYHAEIADDNGCQFASINFNFTSTEDDKAFQNLIGFKNIAIYPNLIPQHSHANISKTFEMCFNETTGYYFHISLLLKRLVGTIYYQGHYFSAESSKVTSHPGEENMVLKAHRYILANRSVAVTVEDLCSFCNVSQSYLYKCFTNVLGLSTKQFITDTKLDIAANDLLQTEKSIAQIATDNGYSNGYQFSNIFKNKYGISPSSYRKIHR